MKRLLATMLLILAALTVAVAQDGQRRVGDRRTAEITQASANDMKGVKIVGNKIWFSRAWKVKKSPSGQTYAWNSLGKKKVKIPVLVVFCKCSGDGASGACYLQNVPGRADALECRSRDCTGACKIETKWEEVEVPAGQVEPSLP